jgi:hypothetical protein
VIPFVGFGVYNLVSCVEIHVDSTEANIKACCVIRFDAVSHCHRKLSESRNFNS